MIKIFDNKNESSETKLFAGLALIKTQWKLLALAIISSLIILALDFLLTISMPKIIDGLKNVMSDSNSLKIPNSLIILTLLLILRPLIGWIINFFQISIILRILRNLENEIVKRSNDLYKEENKKYSNEHAANMLISHGRYFVDNFLIPFIRAITDLGTIVVIAIGILIQYPIPLIFFIVTSFISLTIYQFLSKNLLRENGEVLLRCYEDIIKLAKNGYYGKSRNKKDLSSKILEVLDRKKLANTILGSISQGIKYFVEFCFMLSFGVATMVMFLLSPSAFAAFVATFAYAGVRMLPSFTSIISFFQTRSAAQQAIKELINHLPHNRKK